MKALNIIGVIFLVGTVRLIHMPSILHVVVAFVGICVGLSLLYHVVKTLQPEDGKPVALGRIVSAGVHGILFTGAVAASVYYYVSIGTLTLQRLQQPAISYVMGTLLLLAILAAGRLAFGLVFPGLVVALGLYVWRGDLLSGMWQHPGFSLARTIELLTSSYLGTYGSIAITMSQVVMIYLVFGTLAQHLGLGELMGSAANFMGRLMRSGTAQAAVIGSALFGMINGVSVANVVATGVFTIPIMKRAGYKADTAGAIEASASTLGQLLPPVMGATAFVMADLLNIPYARIATINALPSALLVLTICFAVHLEGIRQRVAPVAISTTGPGWAAIYRLAPVIMLIYEMVGGASLARSAYNALLFVLLIWLLEKVVECLRQPTRQGLASVAKSSVAQLLTALDSSMPSVASIGVAGALIGVLIMLFNMPVTLQVFSGVLVDLAGGNLFLLLLMVAGLCVVLGMGMPTTAAYVITVVLFSPTLGRLGVEPVVAHMFVLYYAVLSSLTPPVAVTIWPAVAISGGNFWRTGFTACYISAAMFVLPFVFVYHPFVIFDPFSVQSLRVYAETLIGFAALSMAVTGIGIGKLAIWQRLLTLALSLVIVSPLGTWSAGAVAVFLAFQALFFLLWRRNRAASPEAIAHSV